MEDRLSCPVCYSPNFEVLSTIDEYPVYMGCVETGDSTDDVFAEQTWVVCSACGILFLKQTAPLELVYLAQHNSSYGGLWLEHHQAFARFVQKFNPKGVLEIGGAMGILSREYGKAFDVIPWTIIEPNPNPVENSNAKFVKGFFKSDHPRDHRIDTIVHSHVFEHVYEPSQFLSDIADYLQDGEKLIFSLPNLSKMLEKKYTNALNFEHTIFLSEPYIEYLLSQHNFQIVKVEYFKEEHSIFYCCRKSTGVQKMTLPSRLVESHKELYLSFTSHYNSEVSRLNSLIKQRASDTVFLFGAHVFLNIYLQMGLISLG